MSGQRLVDGYDGLLLDLDGVVYIGPDAVPGAAPALNLAAEMGLARAYVTNNAARPAVDVSEHLMALGVRAAPEDVVTSAQVAASIVRERHGTEARVLCVGGPGIAIAVRAEGMSVAESALDNPDAVVQGFGPDVGWRDLAEASYAIQAGAEWVATNTDLTIPQPRGLAPGCGSMVNAVRQAVDIDPIVAGKPQPVVFVQAAARVGSLRPLVVGDRLDTDIQGAVAAGFDSLMVLTGVHGVSELLAAPHFRRPTHVAADLGSLYRPLVVAEVDGDQAGAADVFVEERSGVIHLDSGQTPINALRATLALVWAGADRGQHFDVDPELGLLIRSAAPAR